MIVWFTGLSGAGKTTILKELADMLPKWMVLDGHPGIGVPRTSPQVLSISQAAVGLVKAGHDVICAFVSTLDERKEVRVMFGENYIEVLVDTPLAICKDRDPRMMYAKGLVPLVEYERGNPDMTLCTVCKTPEENAAIVYERIQHDR
jgi:adenylylsulfate kinase-like enzyme